jgi:hypothetical protein
VESSAVPVLPNVDDGARDIGGAASSHDGSHDDLEGEVAKNGVTRDWRNDVRETGGAGDRRTDVKRRGLSIFEETCHVRVLRPKVGPSAFWGCGPHVQHRRDEPALADTRL